MNNSAKNRAVNEELDFAGFAPKSRAILNYKRVLTRVLKYWYVILFSIALGLSASFLVNRYTIPIYPVAASIMIKDQGQNAGDFLYNNPIVSSYRNFYNELFILGSFPLLEATVEDLGFNITYIREGGIIDKEAYGQKVPVKIKVLPTKKMPYGRKMKLNILSDKKFSLEYLSDDASPTGRLFDNLSFNDTVAVNGFRLYVELVSPAEPEIDRPLVIRISDPFKMAREYSKRLKASWAQEGASVVNLEINGPIPEKEMDFLRRFIERYQLYDMERKNLAGTKSIEFIDQQLKIIGDSLQVYEGKMEAFKRLNSVTDLTVEATELYEKLKGLEDQRLQITLHFNYYNYLIRYVNEANNYDQIVPPSTVGITDEVLTTLVTQLITLQSGVRGIMKKESSIENPLFTVQMNKVAQIKKDITEGVRSSMAAEQINADFLDNAVRAVKADLAKLPGTQRGLADIQRNYTIQETLFIFLMQKRAEAGISKASTTSDIVLVNPPYQVGEEITPKKFMNYIIGLGAGLAIPLILFILAELFNDRIQSKEDILQVTSIPIIAAIGHNPLEDTMVVKVRPKSVLAESFRTLRSNLNFFTLQHSKKIIMITSSIAKEGKSFTTVNLATVLAFAGNKVLIIGADMRKPKIFTDFNLTNDFGLSSVLSGRMTFEESVQQSGIEGLDLISAGPAPPNPSELLMSPPMEELIKKASELYDFVILDTPPVALVTDALILTRFVHHTIFLVRQNYTPIELLNNLQELYEDGKLPSTSILFNDIRKTGPGYGYGYSYGYGYYYGKKKSDKAGGGYYSE